MLCGKDPDHDVGVAENPVAHETGVSGLGAASTGCALVEGCHVLPWSQRAVISGSFHCRSFSLVLASFHGCHGSCDLRPQQVPWKMETAHPKWFFQGIGF